MKAGRKGATALVALGMSMFFSTGTAQAAPMPEFGADGWPIAVPDSDPAVFVTPDQPSFWDLGQQRPRLLSPFGTSTRIVCDYFPQRCWQADANGRPHQLGALPSPFGSIVPNSPLVLYYQG